MNGEKERSFDPYFNPFMLKLISSFLSIFDRECLTNYVSDNLKLPDTFLPKNDKLEDAISVP